jgi:hypothetical protein
MSPILTAGSVNCEGDRLMPVLSHPLWAIRIKSARKIHLAETEQQHGAPLAITLCGKSYDPADRIKGTKSTHVSILACQVCLEKAGYVDPEKKRYEDIVMLATAIKGLNLSPADSRAFMVHALKVRDERIRLRESQDSNLPAPLG